MKAIDLFAGWGGFSLGAEQAGVSVQWAANHWPLAVLAHKANHPTVKHECQDLRQADWTKLPAYDLLLASPACQGHSQASQPKRRLFHDALRATAWAVVDCADVTEPSAIIVENVIDFRRWRLYPAWCEALRVLGYQLQEMVLTASFHGTPQRRKRLFIVATRDGSQVQLEREPREAPFSSCVDWLGDHSWRAIANANQNVRSRIETGRRNHGSLFLSQHVSNHPGVSLKDPIRTITTKDQWLLVMNERYRSLSTRELARGMGFPDTYNWPEEASRKDIIKGLGNAVCPPLAKKLITRVADSL
jgi:DNA (cytosine-5)-methyltransferase 1